MRDYKITIQAVAVDEGRYTPAQKANMLNGFPAHVGRTLHKTSLSEQDGLIQIFIADTADYGDIQNSDSERVHYISKAKSYMSTVTQTKTYAFQVIMSEHVDGGMGNPGGSVLLETYAQEDNIEIPYEQFENKYLTI